MKRVEELGQEAEPGLNSAERLGRDNLALIYQGLLTGIVRIQAGRQHIPDGETFRRRIKAALEEVERDALALGFSRDDIRDTHFAVVAFLDEVVLNTTDPGRTLWAKRPLQQDMFGDAVAGQAFFEKLERFRSRRDSQQTADILEVYLLCLLLGYEGRYGGKSKAELQNMMVDLRTRIEQVRGPACGLSPPAPAESDMNVPPPARKPNNIWLWVIVPPLAVLLVYVFLKIDLLRTVSGVEELLRSRLPGS
jgi:type VI secretion system protein ImpK